MESLKRVGRSYEVQNYDRKRANGQSTSCDEGCVQRTNEGVGLLDLGLGDGCAANLDGLHVGLGTRTHLATDSNIRVVSPGFDAEDDHRRLPCEHRHVRIGAASAEGK